tara:strand:- start:352 stop:807 length:456 start_codon:yes stop_codon:yes gene_type:complete
MRNLLYITFFIFFFSACTNVEFVSPQPEFAEALTQIPDKYHGEFIIDKDTHVVTSTTIDGISINSDDLIVKERGNYFYVNTKNDSGYFELGIVRHIKFLNYEEIYMLSPQLEERHENLFNFNKDYALENVTVNQLSIITNLSDVESVKRIK